jgi:pimeloyl-ACP methyl ester carboxylesterase
MSIMERPQPNVPGVQHSFVDARGLRTHVAEAGEGEPLVLVHGWPQHWYVWRHLIPRLAERYRVICPDLRGLGWTDAPADGYEKETMAADLLNLLDAMGLERVRLAGHDWGGFAGFLLCLRAPERVERYVAMNTGHPWLQTSGRQLLQLYKLWYQAVLAAPVLGRRAAHKMVETVYKVGLDKDRVSPEEWSHFSDQFEEPARANATVQIYRTFLTREMPAIARGRYTDRRLTVPTLYLHGEGDPVIRPENFDVVSQHADDFRLELVTGTGHFVADEAPDEVLTRMLAFFA